MVDDVEIIPAKWSYSEKVPSLGGEATISTVFTKLDYVIEYLKGNHVKDYQFMDRHRSKIQTEVFVPGYFDDDKKESSSEPESEEDYPEFYTHDTSTDVEETKKYWEELEIKSKPTIDPYARLSTNDAKLRRMSLLQL